MDKIIARKRWFFVFSILITIPGLLFTLATPFSGGSIGLKFSIDYTGGTIWEFRPESPADPLVVQAAVASWDVFPKVPGGQLVHVAAAPTL